MRNEQFQRINFFLSSASLVINYLLIAFLLGGCASSLPPKEEPSPIEELIKTHFIPGTTAFIKATEFVSVDPRTALEHYVEAKVHFENFLKEVEGKSQAEAEAREAQTYIEKANFGIEFVKAQENYENLNIEEICRKVSKNKASASRYREEYNQLLITVKAFKQYEYLESESQRLIKDVEDDLIRLEECVTSTNRRPIAVTGGDLTVSVNSVVTLDGSRSYDPDGGHLTFNWIQIAGPSKVHISNPLESQPTFTPKIHGTYVFRLVVSDGDLESQPQELTVFVQGQISDNKKQKMTDLGTFTHDGITGTLVIITNYHADERTENTIVKKQSTMRPGDSRNFRLDVGSYGDLEVNIPPGYGLQGGGLHFTGQNRYEGDPTIYQRFIRERIRGGTRIDDLKIVRRQHSPDDFRFIFKLYPR